MIWIISPNWFSLDSWVNFESCSHFIVVFLGVHGKVLFCDGIYKIRQSFSWYLNISELWRKECWSIWDLLIVFLSWWMCIRWKCDNWFLIKVILVMKDVIWEKMQCYAIREVIWFQVIEWILSIQFKDDSNFVRMNGREILRK